MDSEHEVNNMQGRVGGEGDDVLVEGMQVDDDDNGGGSGGTLHIHAAAKNGDSHHHHHHHEEEYPLMRRTRKLVAAANNNDGIRPSLVLPHPANTSNNCTASSSPSPSSSSWPSLSYDLIWPDNPWMLCSMAGTEEAKQRFCKIKEGGVWFHTRTREESPKATHTHTQNTKHMGQTYTYIVYT